MTLLYNICLGKGTLSCKTAKYILFLGVSYKAWCALKMQVDPFTSYHLKQNK